MSEGPVVGLGFALGLVAYTVPRERLIAKPAAPLPEIHEYIDAAADGAVDVTGPRPLRLRPVLSEPAYGDWIGGRSVHAKRR